MSGRVVFSLTAAQATALLRVGAAGGPFWYTRVLGGLARRGLVAFGERRVTPTPLGLAAIVLCERLASDSSSRLARISAGGS